MSHLRLPRFPSVVCFCLAAACASGSSQQGAPAQVDELVTWIERVHVEAESGRVAIQDAYERMNALATGRFGQGTAVASYARFVQSIDVTDQQAKRFRDVVGPMQTAAKPVFEQWQKGIASISGDRLRQLSEMRLAVTKERYDAIAKVAVPAQQKFDAYAKSLRDVATFLAHDLNASALDEVQNEVKLVGQNARDLDRDLQGCMDAARSYVEQAALPAAGGSTH